MGVALLVAVAAGIVGLVARAQDGAVVPPAKELADGESPQDGESPEVGESPEDGEPGGDGAGNDTTGPTDPDGSTDSDGSTTTTVDPVTVGSWRFPDASTTGVPEGTELRRLEAEGPVLSLDRDLDGVVYEGAIVIAAPDITIRNSRIVGTSRTAAIWNPEGHRGVTIVDVDVVCTGSPPGSAGIAGAGLTIVRADISGCADGVGAGSGTTVADSYIHDLGFGEDTHNDGIQIGSGSDIRIMGNRIVQLDNGRYQANAAVFVQDTFGPVDGVSIVGNKVDGFGFSLQLAGSRITGSRIVGNVVGAGHLFGPVLVTGGAEEEGQGNRVAGNLRPDGTPIR